LLWRYYYYHHHKQDTNITVLFTLVLSSVELGEETKPSDPEGTTPPSSPKNSSVTKPVLPAATSPKVLPAGSDDKTSDAIMGDPGQHLKRTWEDATESASNSLKALLPAAASPKALLPAAATSPKALLPAAATYASDELSVVSDAMTGDGIALKPVHKPSSLRVAAANTTGAATAERQTTDNAVPAATPHDIAPKPVGKPGSLKVVAKATGGVRVKKVPRHAPKARHAAAKAKGTAMPSTLIMTRAATKAAAATRLQEAAEADASLLDTESTDAIMREEYNKRLWDSGREDEQRSKKKAVASVEVEEELLNPDRSSINSVPFKLGGIMTQSGDNPWDLSTYADSAYLLSEAETENDDDAISMTFHDVVEGL